MRINTSHKQKQQTKLTATQPEPDQRGTKESPVFVDMLSHPKSPREAAEYEDEKQRKAYVDGWTLFIAAVTAGFTGLLVVIGYCGVRAAIKTLRAIESQTKATRDGVDLLINGERAWIVISNIRPADALTRPGFEGSFHQLVFDVKNVGRTAARIIAFKSSWRIKPKGTALPPLPEYGPGETDERTPVNGRVVAPNELIEHINIEVDEPFDTERLNQLRCGELAMWVYAYIEYVDFAERRRRIQFCCGYVKPTERQPVPRFMVAGPKDYNTHT